MDAAGRREGVNLELIRYCGPEGHHYDIGIT